MKDQQQHQELLDEIRALRRQLAEEKADRKALQEQLKLVDEVTELKKTISDLEIKKSKLTEGHERERRDVMHMVGLEKKRQEFEIQQAKRETTVTVREENLGADRKRFEDAMEFTQQRFEAEVGYLRDIMAQVLDRLPTVTVDRSITTPKKVA